MQAGLFAFGRIERLLVAGVVLASLQAANPHPALAQQNAKSSVSWVFETRKDATETPHTQVFLTTSHGRVLIQKDVTAEFQTMKFQDFGTYKIPIHAVAACTGFFAGQGEDLYVRRQGKKLLVFLRRTDEQDAADEPYKQIKSIAP